MNFSLIDDMTSGTIENYIVPGLRSQLLGASEFGKVRMFAIDRDQQEFVTPHSHRYDLQCIVLAGEVHNTIWTPRNEEGDEYAVSELHYDGKPGAYTPSSTYLETKRFIQRTRQYHSGQSYYMKYDEIHSIRFLCGARVLVLEGPEKSKVSQILEPIVMGFRVASFFVEPWMFVRHPGPRRS